jgi:hypothetical protein
MDVGLWGCYLVTVTSPEGKVEWARAEAKCLPAVWQLQMYVVQPVKQAGQYVPMHHTAAGQAVRFEAVAESDTRGFPAAELGTGKRLTSGVTWKWDFGDGHAAEENPVSHSFAQGVYTVTVSAAYQGATVQQHFSLQALTGWTGGPNVPTPARAPTRSPRR